MSTSLTHGTSGCQRRSRGAFGGYKMLPGTAANLVRSRLAVPINQGDYRRPADPRERELSRRSNHDRHQPKRNHRQGYAKLLVQHVSRQTRRDLRRARLDCLVPVAVFVDLALVAVHVIVDAEIHRRQVERSGSRPDQAGLLWLIEGRSLFALSRDAAVMGPPSEGGQRHYRRRAGKPTQNVMAWELPEDRAPGWRCDAPATARSYSAT
jgi:hypothetical protein